mgnify:CR=1 FL=1
MKDIELGIDVKSNRNLLLQHVGVVLHPKDRWPLQSVFRGKIEQQPLGTM